jgi:hypothetical protein
MLGLLIRISILGIFIPPGFDTEERVYSLKGDNTALLTKACVDAAWQGSRLLPIGTRMLRNRPKSWMGVYHAVIC